MKFKEQVLLVPSSLVFILLTLAENPESETPSQMLAYPCFFKKDANPVVIDLICEIFHLKLDHF
jgi:hypothetical protein